VRPSGFAETVAAPYRIIERVLPVSMTERDRRLAPKGHDPSLGTRPKDRRRSLPRSFPLTETATIGDLLKRLGNIPAERIRLNPTPGTTIEKDVVDV
jgi:hypothetical protein